MFVHSPLQVIGNANIQSAGVIGHDVHVVVGHGRSRFFAGAQNDTLSRYPAPRAFLRKLAALESATVTGEALKKGA